MKKLNEFLNKNTKSKNGNIKYTESVLQIYKLKCVLKYENV